MPGLRFAAAPKTGRLLRILFVRLSTVSAEANRRLMLLKLAVRLFPELVSAGAHRSSPSTPGVGYDEHRSWKTGVAGVFLG
jgi:hypothetical protein